MSGATQLNSAPIAAQRPLDADTQRATRLFLKKIGGRYPLHEVFLFGSRARGTHNADSDADVAVILRGERGNRYEVACDLGGIEFDVMLETGILIQAVPFWEEEFKQPDIFSNPELIRNIQREGLRL